MFFIELQLFKGYSKQYPYIFHHVIGHADYNNTMLVGPNFATTKLTHYSHGLGPNGNFQSMWIPKKIEKKNEITNNKAASLMEN